VRAQPNPRDERGFDSRESTVGVRYVLQRTGVLPISDADAAAGVAGPEAGWHLIDPTHVWEEGLSLDTIGNAFFLRTMHTDPCGLRQLRVFTNDFHMPRVQGIFDFVFSLPRHDGEAVSPPYRMEYVSVPDAGMAADVAAARRERESASLVSFRRQAAEVSTLHGVHAWLFNRHGAYNSQRLCGAKPADVVDPKVLASY
jgi:hypothetical protein